jgi:Fe-S-cluster containining protein
MISPTEVKSAASRLEDANIKFRSFLKGHADENELDAQFLRLHNELFANYDCRKCANCCREYGTALSDAEVSRIAAFLGQPEDEFIAEYLTANKPDDDGKRYQIEQKPCPFLLKDGRCRVQDCKPDDCRAYPYTDKPGRLWSLLGVLRNAKVCPVVFEILERLKPTYHFRSFI